MKYLLDTNICIYIIRRKPLQVLRRFETLKAGDVGISSITLAELSYGVAKSQHKKINQEALESFTLPLEIAPFDTGTAAAYGEMRARLELQGISIGPLDLLIAAHAARLGLTLITNDVQEFSRIEGLSIENWVDG